VREAVLQRQIVDGLRARGAEVIVTHDAKHKPVTTGITDLIVLTIGRTIFIEVKGEGGAASEEQMSFIARIRALGYTAIVARSWDDVERFL
jgi:hypothetical protein